VDKQGDLFEAARSARGSIFSQWGESENQQDYRLTTAGKRRFQAEAEKRSPVTFRRGGRCVSIR